MSQYDKLPNKDKAEVVYQTLIFKKMGFTNSELRVRYETGTDGKVRADVVPAMILGDRDELH